MSAQVPQQLRLCPILTLGALASKPPPSRIVGAPGAAPQAAGGFEAVPCAGTQCAFFIGIQDEKGRISGGNCTMNLIATGLGMLNQSVREAAALGVMGVPDAEVAKKTADGSAS